MTKAIATILIILMVYGCVRSSRKKTDIPPKLKTSETETPAHKPKAGVEKLSDGHFIIEQPILLGGYIAGDISGGIFRPIDWSAIGGITNKWQESDFPKTVLSFVRIPERIRLFRDDGAEDFWTPINAILGLNCGGMEMLEFDWKESDWPPFNALLGIDATWSGTIRNPVEQNEKAVWNDALKELLIKEGKPNAPVRIERVEKIDLSGDSKEDIVIFSGNVHWQGRCAQNPKGNGCSTGSEHDKERSYGIVAFALDERGPLRTLLYYFDGDSQVNTLDGWMYADLDGDNSMEFIYHVHYYEGWWAKVLRIGEESIEEFISFDCII